MFLGGRTLCAPTQNGLFEIESELLDTNVLSELKKESIGKAEARVVAWAKNVIARDLFLSAITILEIEKGVLQIERRDARQGRLPHLWLEDHVLPAFEGRILPVDVGVARRCVSLHVPNPSAERDALIAATAFVHGLTVVTRNVVDFKFPNLETLNPWEDKGGTNVHVHAEQ